MSSTLNSKTSIPQTFNPQFLFCFISLDSFQLATFVCRLPSAPCACRWISLSINPLKWFCSPLSLPASGLAGTSAYSGCLEGRSQKQRCWVLGLKVPSRGCAPYMGVMRSRLKEHAGSAVPALPVVGWGLQCQRHFCLCGVSRAPLKNDQVFPECCS